MRAHASQRRAALAAAAGALIAVVALLGPTPAIAAQGSGGTGATGHNSGGEGHDPGAGHGLGQDPGGADQDQLGKVRLVSTAVTPGSLFAFGDPVSFEFEVDGFGGSVDLTVEVLSQRTREVVRRIPVEGVQAGVPATVQWAGRTDHNGRARPGVYRFQVHAREAGKVESDSAQGQRTIGYYGYKFPVRGPHQYGDGIGAGRAHRGQDVFADCGTILEAARGGKVQFEGFQASGAGYYVVIDGKRTGRDFVYMHLRQGAEVVQGERVRTGQRIGEVGETGNASGCHLHFELWSRPGWYEGGSFLNPTPALKRWDSYS